MRTLFFISIVFLLTAVSCDKEEWQTVAINGNYTNTPDLAGGFHNLALPDGSIFPVPKKYIVSGSDNLIGTIDATKSVLTVESVVINPLTGAFDMEVHVALYNADGDAMQLEGPAQALANNTGLSWFHYTDGAGKFEDISGWLNTTIVTNPTTGVHTVTGTGEATYQQ